MASNGDELRDLKDLAYKLLVYVPGVFLGLAAKLSKMNQEEKLTWSSGLYHSLLAFAVSYIVWFILTRYDQDWVAGPAAVICGRFGDEVLKFLWSWFKLFIQSLLKQIK